MRTARVIGKVVAVRTASGLEGNRFLLLQGVGTSGEDVGAPFIACDVVGAGEGARVFWIGAREAAIALPQPEVPVDATCVALWESPPAASEVGNGAG